MKFKLVLDESVPKYGSVPLNQQTGEFSPAQMRKLFRLQAIASRGNTKPLLAFLSRTQMKQEAFFQELPPKEDGVRTLACHPDIYNGMAPDVKANFELVEEVTGMDA